MNLTASQGAAALLVTFSVLSWLSPTFLSYVALIPMNTITGHFYIWNLVTAGVVDSSPVTGIACAGVVWWGGGKVESLWGYSETVKYLVIVTVASSVSVFFMCLVAYISGSEGWFYMYFCGGVGVAAAMLVVLKQLHPDDQIIEGIPVRFKWLPLCAVCVAVLAEIIFPTHIPTDAEISGASLRGPVLPHVLLSTFVAWFYLRYHQSLTQATTGDPSENFAFKSFFPNPIRPVAGLIADVAFAALNRVFCGFGNAILEAEEAARRKAEDDSNPFLSPPPATSVADMRRQVALSALHDRLQQAQQQDDPAQGLEAFDIEIGTDQAAAGSN